MRRFDSGGTPLGDEMEVNVYPTGPQRAPKVALDAASNFVVVWSSGTSTDPFFSDNSIQMRRYLADGTPRDAQFQVDSYLGPEGAPDVTADPEGNLVVVWDSFGSAGTDRSDFSVQGQRYDAAGIPQGGQFQVNGYTTGAQRAARVAADAAGNFVVVWQSFGSAGSDGSGYSIQAQRYDASGAPQGGQFQVNTYTTDQQTVADVAADPAGSFLVSWDSLGSDGADSDGLSIQARRYDSGGAPDGGQFEVNTYTTSFQSRPDVAADDAGNFVVAWFGYGSAGSDTSGSSIHAQRFAVPTTSSTSSTSISSTSTPSTSSSSTSSSSTSSTSTSTSTTSTLSSAADHLLPGRITVIKPNRLARFTAKPLPGDAFALPSENPAVAGGMLRIFDGGSTAGDDSYALPAPGWRGLGNPAGSKGYRYRGAAGDPCAVVIVTASVIKATCKGPGVTLTPPFTGDVDIVLAIGEADRYCAAFGGDDVRNDATITRRRNAPAPATCP